MASSGYGFPVCRPSGGGVEPERCRRGQGSTAPPVAAQLALLRTMPVGGTGGWDYICADSRGPPPLRAAGTHTQILDLDTGAVLGDIPDTNGVHGVALAPDQGLGFTSNGNDGTVSVFDVKTFKVSKIIKVGTKPDPLCTTAPASTSWRSTTAAEP